MLGESARSDEGLALPSLEPLMSAARAKVEMPEVEEEPPLRRLLELRRRLREFLFRLTDWPILRLRLSLKLSRPWRGESFVTPYVRSTLGLGLTEQQRARLPGAERALERLFRPDKNSPTPFYLTSSPLRFESRELQVELSLLGAQSCQDVDVFVRALLQGRLGKVSFRLQRLEQGGLNDDFGLSWIERAWNSFGLLSETRPGVLSDWALQPHPMPLRKIHCPTGLLLGRDSDPELSLPFLSDAALRKLRDLSRAFSRNPISEEDYRDWRELLRDELRQWDWSLDRVEPISFSRYSARQGQRHPIRGQIFEMTFDDALGLTRPLFAACALTGLGRKTSMGLGRLELSP